MPIRKYKPTSPGRRQMTVQTFDEITTNEPYKPLTENLHRAGNLKRLPRIRELHSPLITTLSDLLDRGAKQGLFRKGVDPIQLYISIAALGFFYLSNRHTLSTIFGRDLNAPAALDERGQHVVDVVLGYLRP